MSAPKRMIARFAGMCKRCGGGFAAGASIEWSAGFGAVHATAAACAAAPKAPEAPTAVTLNLKALADFLIAARDRGLKFPKARFLAPEGKELRLNLAGEQAKVPGSLQVLVDGEWFGRVEPDGRVVGSRLLGDDRLQKTLVALTVDPALAAKEYAQLVGRCSFCDLALTDAGSIEVGYGPICAKRWGLPHSPKGAVVIQTEVKALAAGDGDRVDRADAYYSARLGY